MRILAILSAMLVVSALTACDGGGDGNPGGAGGSGATGGAGGTGGSGATGGTGGSGATGGTGGSTVVSGCETYCMALDGCGVLDGDTVADCVAWCEAELAAVPEEVLRECGTCLAGTECSEWEISCNAECGDPGPTGFTLTLEATGFTQWDSKPFFIQIADGAGAAIASGDWVIGVDEDADFEFVFDEFFEAGETLVIDYFVDVDVSGTCNDGDQAGHYEFVNLQADLLVQFDGAAASDLQACVPFANLPVDLLLSSNGFSAFHDQMFYVSVEDTAGVAQIRGNWRIGRDGEDDFEVPARKLLTVGESYVVKYFVDVDGDGACGAGDHVATVAVPTVIGNTVVVLDAADTVDTGHCSDFGWIPKNFVLEGTGLEAAEGAVVAAAVKVSFFGMSFTVDSSSAIVENGTVRVVVPGVLEDDSEYSVDWFVDSDADLLCGGGDFGGEITGLMPPFAATVIRTVTPADAGTLVCKSFPEFLPGVIASGSGFAAHNGAYVEAYLVDRAAPAEYAAYAFGEVKNGGFELALTSLSLAGTDYEVLWLVDVDDDLFCNMPPDLAGRITIGPVSGKGTAVITAGDAMDVPACDEMNAFWD